MDGQHKVYEVNHKQLQRHVNEINNMNISVKQ